MENWAREQNEAMRGYILLAIRYANSESRAEYGTDVIDEAAKGALLKKLWRACDDLTADEARKFYLASDDE